MKLKSIANKIEKYLNNEFEKELLFSAIDQLKDVNNPLRFNNFAYSFRELIRNVYSRLGPDEEVMKCSWYKEIKRNPKDPKIKRFERVKYSIQGGLSNNFVKNQLLFDIEYSKIIRNLIKELNKYTHITEKVFDIDFFEGEEMVLNALQTLSELFKEVEIFRNKLESKYEEILYEKLLDTFIEETFEDLDIIATHYIVKNFQIERVKVISIDYEKVKIKIEGTLEIEHQWGSSSDMRNDIGTNINNSYPFEINTQINVETPLEININKNEIIIDDSSWYN